MRIGRRSILLGLLVLAEAATPADAGRAECDQKIDPALAGVLKDTFREFRIPRLSDLDASSVEFDIRAGGDGCYAVATGDFDADHSIDTAVVLSPRSGTKPVLVAALRRGESWSVSKLPTYCESASVCYARSTPPGTYVRSLAIDGPMSHTDERERATSAAMSIVSGRLESTSVVYVFTDNQWVHVWTSD